MTLNSLLALKPGQKVRIIVPISAYKHHLAIVKAHVKMCNKRCRKAGPVVEVDIIDGLGATGLWYHADEIEVVND